MSLVQIRLTTEIVAPLGLVLSLIVVEKTKHLAIGMNVLPISNRTRVMELFGL